MKKFCYKATFLFLILAFSSVILISSVTAESSAFVWSDKKEYFPDETARIFGYGFNPFSAIEVTIVRPDLNTDVIITNTDEFGYFECQYQLDGVHGVFNVTANDGTSTATTTFENCLSLQTKWSSHCCWYIWAKAKGLRVSRNYYVKYFDPAGVERRQGPTYSGVRWFKDNFTLVPSLQNILGQWTVKLYENDVTRRVDQVYVNAMVWTTNSTYNNLVTSFYQGETIYFKAIGLKTNYYYRFMFETPSRSKIYVGDWTTGVETLTGNYTLPSDAETGSWKLHVREAVDASGTSEHHYVDTCHFQVTSAPPPVYYYLTVKTDPEGIVTIPGEGWYEANTYVNLTAPELVNGPADNIRYRFNYWDVDGIQQGTGVSDISIFMDANHSATAHYIIQYYLNMTSNPPSVTVPAGSGWYDGGSNVSIFTPTYVSIIADASRYKFVNWTTADITEIENCTSPSTMVYMDKPKTVAANYIVQYITTFNQTGVEADFTGGVINIDGCNYGVADLPISFWWDEGSTHNFAFHSPLIVTSNEKRYVWYSTSGLSNKQSDVVTVITNGSITGNYVTQYYLAVTSSFGTPTGEGWYNSSITAYAGLDTDIVDYGNGTRRVFVNWTGDASGTSYTQSDPIIMDAPKTATANWKMQYLLTVLTDPAGLSPQPTRNPVGEQGSANSWWYDESISVNITAQSVSGYTFNYWDVDGSSTGTGVNPIILDMNAPHNATAHYTQIPPLSVSISPTTAMIKLGESVTFTSTVSGGEPPYQYQWLLNGTAVSGATSSSWAFTPSITGYYVVQLNVIDNLTNTAKSNQATVTVAPPLTVSISPTSASILVGQSITFTSTVSGGYSPYSYQWYLNDNPVSGATSNSWTFTPSASGIYYVYLKVTDAQNNIARSDAARIVVSTVPVGGYSVSLVRPTVKAPLFLYTMLLIFLGTVVSLIRRKRK